MNEIKFEVGDTVKILKPDDTEMGPGWIADMDEYDGKIRKIIEIEYDGDIVFEDGKVRPRRSFHPTWLRLISRANCPPVDANLAMLDRDLDGPTDEITYDVRRPVHPSEQRYEALTTVAPIGKHRSA